MAVGSGCDENIWGSTSGRAIISRRSQSFSARRRSFSCFSSLTWDSNSLADSSSAASRCFFLMRKRALAAVFLLRLSSSIARRFVSASASGLPVSTSLTRSASVEDEGRPRWDCVLSSNAVPRCETSSPAGSRDIDALRFWVAAGIDDNGGDILDSWGRGCECIAERDAHEDDAVEVGDTDVAAAAAELRFVAWDAAMAPVEGAEDEDDKCDVWLGGCQDGNPGCEGLDERACHKLASISGFLFRRCWRASVDVRSHSWLGDDDEAECTGCCCRCCSCCCCCCGGGVMDEEEAEGALEKASICPALVHGWDTCGAKSGFALSRVRGSCWYDDESASTPVLMDEGDVESGDGLGICKDGRADTGCVGSRSSARSLSRAALEWAPEAAICRWRSLSSCRSRSSWSFSGWLSFSSSAMSACPIGPSKEKLAFVHIASWFAKLFITSSEAEEPAELCVICCADGEEIEFRLARSVSDDEEIVWLWLGVVWWSWDWWLGVSCTWLSPSKNAIELPWSLDIVSSLWWGQFQERRWICAINSVLRWTYCR